MSVIVVGVDGSETAAQAASTAAGLASALGTSLHVVSAFPTGNPGPTDATGPTSRDTAEELALTTAGALRSAYPDLTVNSDAEPGKPAEALVNAAETAGATLIVIGNKRVQGVSRILGSVAVDVVRKAPCDVYIAHTTG
ncbi:MULTISPECIES: universal stress protein [unclassified Nocardioides]|uniref:universal stress protein n=1 Tax=unclassified Nocardioides TaxID=2615069 RepID=UPI0030154AE1